MSRRSKSDICRDGMAPPFQWRSAEAASRLREAAAPFFARDRRALLLGALRAADIVVIVLAGVAGYGLRHGTLQIPTLYIWQIVAGTAIAAVALHAARLYTFRSLRQPTRHLVGVALSWGAAALLTTAIVFFARVADEISRAWVLIWALIGLAGLVGIRFAARYGLARWSRSGKLIFNVAVVGPATAAAALARRLAREGAGDTRVLGVFALPTEGEAGEVDALAALARRERVDEVVFALPCAGAAPVRAALRTLGTLPADIRLSVELEGVLPSAQASLLIYQRPLAGWRIIVKRTMDVALSGALLIVFAPLMAVVAALVKLDSRGPVIFRQQRFGFNKQPFTVYKFRTMHCGADDPTVLQARRSDPRVTRLGGFLRRSSLDELPQLFNVLGGSMSLVGPRPHAIVHDEKYAMLIDGYLARHRVLPGITGWAQVNGLRGETETTEKMARRIEHDLFYIDHWSPFFDIRILARTVRIAFGDRNAY
jgi:Undecaprenyl-phosphate glucose phosphotransferase